MRHDSGNGQVQGHRNVYQWFSVLENGGNKFVHEITMRSTVATCRNAGRQRWSAGRGQQAFSPFKLSIEGSFLASHTAHLAAISGGIPADAHARHATFAGPEQGNLRAEGVAVSVV